MGDIPDASVDLIFTDLPYGQIMCEWDKKIDLSVMWEHFMRIKKTHTPIFFCCSTKFGAELIQSAPDKCPFRYDIVWAKSKVCGHLQARRMPMRKHEMVYAFYEKLPLYDISSHIAHIKAKPSKKKIDSQKLSLSEKKTQGGMYGKDWGDGHQQSSYDPPLPTSILEIKSQIGKHTTQKPTDLIQWFLKYFSKEGDTVLDPTMGSGSTGVACLNMGRDFIGMELNPEIYATAVERLAGPSDDDPSASK